ncbi:SDR family oxidoreductase [Insolitispirillum peregrinum]|uniref:Short-chain dehydrogenase n=1 Tax=Insolitispirillum peregrinum TaxID=80876 RepID=A0A1N7MJG4_9PROT|nr:SDR family oxidoreductase [Insolitispirillum peregrinum]SIS86314.1 Short-chain dehydrogenase [Insolitispirillum peregrinum]
MPCVLITGANRGLGLEFARQYRDAGWRVIACCRAPEQAPALQALGVEVEALEVPDADSLAALAHRLAGQPVNLLINNAGIYGAHAHQAFGTVDCASFLAAQQVNAFGPLAVTQALVSNLRAAVAAGGTATVAIVSSRMGSIGEMPGGSYIYRASKASVNMVGAGLSHDLKPDGIAVVLLHPGWVRTDMGGPDGMLDAPESVSGMRAAIAATSLDRTGLFVDYQGKELPW